MSSHEMRKELKKEIKYLYKNEKEQVFQIMIGPVLLSFVIGFVMSFLVGFTTEVSGPINVTSLLLLGIYILMGLAMGILTFNVSNMVLINLYDLLDGNEVPHGFWSKMFRSKYFKKTMPLASLEAVIFIVVYAILCIVIIFGVSALLHLNSLSWSREIFIILLLGIVLMFISVGVFVILCPYFATILVLKRNIDNNKDNLSIFSSLKQSRQLMKSHKWQYFVLILSTLGWIVLIVVIWGIVRIVLPDLGYIIYLILLIFYSAYLSGVQTNFFYHLFNNKKK
ncbi:DUF975 family protein [Bombilactobacillus thymidiniphilus]|uniref:DUF975 family protein n=1 Tax=Bombilactobacillus thymidiniphilus TaxID=2923363 RepID=A0ABY4PG48_9LACO|nr:DUF975 family protein [Bombilactobacillus thymidiniphilus]UQS84297.1 DUF975 family protein [Bombilactobacillus thymidiniphilus]